MTEESQLSSVSQIQTQLALSRTVMAMDRTLLAWVRTSLSLIAFGFTLAKFVHNLILSGSFHVVDAQYPRQLGITLMALGILGLLGGAFDHWRAVKRLKGSVDISAWSAALVVALVLTLISVTLMIDLVINLNPQK